jgi:hypothetical protein
MIKPSLLGFSLLLLMLPPCRAQESPYFVTYDHHLEEPGNLEVEAFTTIGAPRTGEHAFVAPYSEFEYGLTGWWTTELYLEGQSTPADSTIFTGWRLENRWRPLAREHIVNPVLYLEYESLNEATRIFKELVGTAPSAGEPNSELRQHHAHELEGKLILSSNVRDWNLAGNFIVEKNLSATEGFEFGYALGASRPLARLASASSCHFCRENFAIGAELYGGLGSTHAFSFHQTAHYLAPVVSWQINDNMSLHLSVAAGLTPSSNPALVRVGYKYEIQDFRRKVSALFGAKE